MATEFDFDELDKAVNSLMKDTDPTPEPESPQAVVAAPAAVTEPAPVAVVEEPAITPVPATVPESTSAPELSPEQAPTITPKTSGRFMDVVHPSSDMRSPIPPVSRKGVELSPVTPSMSAPTETVAAQDEVLTNQDTPAPSADLGSTPLESPFLPDAQVEKRPLGGTPPASPSLDAAMAAELSGTGAAEESTAEAPETSDSIVATPDVAPESPSVPQEAAGEQDEAVPEELNNDLVAIESGEAQADDSATVAPVEQAAIQPETMAETAVIPATAVLSQSIPQQYEEQPSTGDESHAPIYDDQSTSQTLAHPAKKSSARIFVIAGVLILLGIGGAVGVYFLQFGS